MQDFAGHYGHWPLVLIMVVVASWIVYRYLAPKSWREWSGEWRRLFSAVAPAADERQL